MVKKAANNLKAVTPDKSALTVDRAALIGSLPMAYLAYEAAEPYRIIDENAAHERVALTKREDIIGQPFLSVFPDTSQAFKTTGKSAPIESIKKIVRTGKPDSLGEFNYDIRAKDGSYVTKYWKSTQYPIFGDDGTTVIAVYQLTEDITDMKLTERQLALTKYQLAQTLANGLIGTWIWDLKHKRVYGDDNMAYMFGLPAATTIEGLSPDDFLKGVYEQDRARVNRNIMEVLEKQSNFEQEFRTIDRDGHMRWIITRGRVEKNKAGELDRFPGVAIDITERKRANDLQLFLADVSKQMSASLNYYTNLSLVANMCVPRMADWCLVDLYDEQDSSFEQITIAHNDPAKITSMQAYRKQYPLTKNGLGGASQVIRTGKSEFYPQLQSKTLTPKIRHVATLELIRRFNIQSIIIVPLMIKDIPIGAITFMMSDSGRCLNNDDFHLAQEMAAQISLAMTNAKLYEDSERELLERKQAEKALKASEHQFQVFADNLPVLAWRADARGNIHWYNSQWYEYTGKTREEMIGWGWQSVHHPDTLQQVVEGFSLSIDTGTPFEMTFPLQAANGKFHPFLTRIEPIRDASGVVMYWFGTNTNISEQKRLEKELLVEQQKLESRVLERTEQLRLTNQGLRDEIIKRRHTEAELKSQTHSLSRSNQELQDFAYVASHDLQEPLRKIQAFSNLLNSEFSEQLGEGKDYLERMRSAAARMSTLIEDLLSFSRVTTQAKPSVSVDLNKTVADVLSDLEARIEDTNGQVHVGHLPTVEADPTHMRQLFQNLIGNALKFHKPNQPAEVHVESHEENSEMVLTVSDNGIGFDDKYAQRIFAVFQRLHDRGSYEGTGIGLAVCRKIVERYDGTITAHGTKNSGSTFVIRFPKKG